jgi:hypothetical protein
MENLHILFYLNKIQCVQLSINHFDRATNKVNKYKNIYIKSF